MMSDDISEDGDNTVDAASNGGATLKKHYLKHGRKTSKVWNKMSWFSRRSSRRARTEAEEEDDVKDRPMSWGSSSSSEGDLSLASLQFRLQRQNPHGSEIMEQHCCKPIHHLEVARQCDSRTAAKLLQLKNSGDIGTEFRISDVESLSRTSSMPDGVVVPKEHCHCLACCNCTTTQRLEGHCPAYLQRCTSTRSLDTALSELQYTLDYDAQRGFDDDSSQPTLTILAGSQSSTKTGLQTQTQSPQKDNSRTLSPVNIMPNCLNQSLLRKCKQCGKILRQCHLPKSTKTSSSAQGDNMKLLESSIDYCECRTCNQRTTTKRYNDTADNEIESESYSAQSSPFKDKVSPQDFRHKAHDIATWFGEFNNEQKNLVLKRLLDACELPQTHLLSVHLGPQLHLGCPPNCQDLISWLPSHLATYILSFLDPVSLSTASSVCRVWQSLCKQSILWQAFTRRPAWKLSTTGEQKQLMNHRLPNGEIDWKKVFAERYRLRNNWLKGRCTIRTFEGHTQGISCVQFDDTRIVSGSSDKTIKVWNIRTNSPWSVQTLVGHSGTVRCLHLDGNRLVSGSSDRTIKVWDLSTQQMWSSIACKVTMIGHEDTVRCLQVDEEKVISGSYDKTLKIWNVKTGECSKTLRGHEAAVLCVQFDKKKIVSGSCDKTIKVWSLSGDCMMTLRGHQDAVTCLQFDDKRIISGSLDCNLKFWHLQSGRCENTIDWKASEGHTGVVRCLQADSWRVVSASDDKTLKVWSLDTCQRLVTLKNHTDGVTCVQFNDNYVVSGSYDKTVILRDFSCV